MRKSRQIVWLVVVCFVAFILVPGVQAESFRGSIVGFAVASPGSTYSVELAAGDVIVITPGRDQPFVQGFEITLNVPRQDSGMVGNYAVRLYSRVAAPNVSGPATVIGELLDSQILSSGGRRFLVVPFADVEQSIRETADTRVLPAVHRIEETPIAIQLVPIMKGMNAATGTVKLPVQVRPVVASVGGLVVDLTVGDEDIDPENARITVDGWPVQSGEIVELDPGIYSVKLESADAVDEVRNVGVEAGKLTRVVFSLRRPLASVRLSVPNVAQVSVDGRNVTTTELSLDPGEHTLLIRIGDYSVSRRILLEGETEYEIGLSLDIFIRKD